MILKYYIKISSRNGGSYRLLHDVAFGGFIRSGMDARIVGGRLFGLRRH